MALVAGIGPGTSPSITPRTPHVAPRGTHPADGATHTDRFAGLQVQGRLQAGALRLGDLVLSPADGELHYAGGFLTIHRLKGGFYGGTLSGEVVHDGRGQLPHTSIFAHLEGVQTEPLLKALRQERWTLRGNMTLDSRLQLSGQPGPDVLTRASGQGELIVTGARLNGYLPLERLSQTLDPILKGAGLSSTLNDFDRLSAHWTLDGGMLRTRDLTLQR